MKQSLKVLAQDADFIEGCAAEKFDKKSFVKVCDLINVDILVTNSAPSEKWVGYCEDNGIELVY